MDRIPIINLGNLGNLKEFPDKVNTDKWKVWKSQAADIRKACGEVGFMQLINHGIPNESISNVFEQSNLFFNLPNETKMKYQKPKIDSIDSYFGYNKPGQENVIFQGKAVFEFRETYDWIEGRGVYPDTELPTFEQKVNTLHEHCKHLAKKILRLWAIGLEVDDTEFFIKKHQHWIHNTKFTGLTNIRLAHYPKILDSTDIPEGSVRISEHTDFVSLTFLFQDNVAGLEAKNVNGNWIPVDPIPGAIVLNTGDLLEFWTSGLFPATPHRVRIPDSAVQKRLPRYSIAYFSGPDAAEIVSPLKLIRTPEEERRIAASNKTYSSDPIIAGDHVMNKLKSAYDTAYLNQE